MLLNAMNRLSSSGEMKKLDWFLGFASIGWGAFKYSTGDTHTAALYLVAGTVGLVATYFNVAEKLKKHLLRKIIRK